LAFSQVFRVAAKTIHSRWRCSQLIDGAATLLEIGGRLCCHFGCIIARCSHCSATKKL